MKKLSLIMAMVLIATIGGVYATWTYANDEANFLQTRTNQASMSGISINGNAGTYEIISNVTALTIEQMGSGVGIADGDYHKAKLVVDYKDGATEANIEIRFTPAADASSEQKTKGVDTWFWLDSTSGFINTYGTENIFNYVYYYIPDDPGTDGVNEKDDHSLKINPIGQGGNEWTMVDSNSDGIAEYFTYSIITDAANIDGLLTLGNITLDTADKYYEFQDKLNGFIRLTVSSTTPDTTVYPTQAP